MVVPDELVIGLSDKKDDRLGITVKNCLMNVWLPKRFVFGAFLMRFSSK